MAKEEKFSTKTLVAEWEKGTSETRSLRTEYNMVDLFLRGQQWIYHDPYNGRIETFFPNNDERRARPVMNQMGPSFESLMHRALQRSLVFEVTPTGADDESVQGAKIAEAAIRYLHYSQNWEDKKDQFARAVKKGGIAALAIDWDADAGEELEGEDDDGNQLHQGEASLSILNITEFVVEPGSRDAETARWWIKAQVLPSKLVQSKYNLPRQPEKTDGISPYGQNLSSSRGVGSAPEGTLVLTYYERPNPLTPDGKVVTHVYGRDEFVFGPEPWPFPFTDRLNLVVGKDIAQEGKWYGTSLYSQAIPVQSSLNACWAAIIEHNAAIGNARMIVPSSNTAVLEQLTDDPSHPVVVAANEEKPSYMIPPPLPQGLVQEVQMLKEVLDDLLAVHDISRGEGSGRVESGYGISLLIEQDNSPTGHLVKTVASSFERAASLCLQLYEVNTTSSRESMVFIPGQPAASIKWSGKDLSGQTQVNIPVDQVLPRSRAAAQELAKTLVQMQMIQPGDLGKFAKIADLPGAQDLMWEADPITARAQWDIHAMGEGVPVDVPEGFHQPGDYDIAISTVRNFMLTPKWDRLPDNEKELMRLYIKGCETMQASKVAEQQRRATMNQQLAPNGMPLPPPPPQELISPTIASEQPVQ